MNFETTDWDAEARRIKAAFGVEGECEFVEGTGNRKGFWWLLEANSEQKCLTEEGYELEVIYGPAIRRFRITLSGRWFSREQSKSPDFGGRGIIDDTSYFWVKRREERQAFGVDQALIDIGWDGSIKWVNPNPKYEPFIHDYGTPMVRALSHLGLLTPEIEAALIVKVSEPQKVEWTLEKNWSRGSTANYETLNWEAEAQHLKKALGVAKSCEWVEILHFYHRGGPATNGKILAVEPNGIGPILCKGGEKIRVIYDQKGFLFHLCRDSKEYCGVFLSWDGNSSKVWAEDGADMTPLNRALFRLTSLSSEVAIEMDSPAHEKMEWTLELDREDLK